MIAPLRRSEAVIPELCDLMNRSVTAYTSGAVKVSGRIEGTAFFPGGMGLWRGYDPSGSLSEFFPTSPVMVVGHNFDSVRGHLESIRRGIERMKQGTWKFLLEYLRAAAVTPEDCFFTNVFVGLQPDKAEGKMYGSEQYFEQCRVFLRHQTQIVKPKLILVLGSDARNQVEIARVDCRSIYLRHPGNFRFVKKSDHESLIRAQGEMISKALRA